MAIKFTKLVKHGRFAFAPGVSYAFEDADAEPYFKAAGWAEDTADAPVMTLTLGEVDIDPATIFAAGTNKGARVMGGEG